MAGSTSGSVTLAVPAVAGSNTATLPAATGTVMVSGNMPAFRATTSGNTACPTNTYTKIQFNTKTFDTNSCFDATTNFRFTPNVQGYYQVTGAISFGSYTASYVNLSIWKNGSQYGPNGSGYSAGTGEVTFTTADLVYCNGTTDYIELYVVQGTTGTLNASGGVFSAVLTRTA